MTASVRCGAARPSRQPWTSYPQDICAIETLPTLQGLSYGLDGGEVTFVGLRGSLLRRLSLDGRIITVHCFDPLLSCARLARLTFWIEDCLPLEHCALYIQIFGLIWRYLEV